MKSQLLILLFFISLKSIGQNEVDFSTIDKKTYEAYQNGAWKDLIYWGNKAGKLDIEYYYLSYRMAVAYFQTGNYMNSAYYYEKAIEQNSGAVKDTNLIKTLYLDYIYTHNYSKAEGINQYHPDSKIQKKYHLPFIKQIYLENGSSITDNITDKAFKERKLYYYKEIDQFKGMNYWNFDMQGYLEEFTQYQVAFTGMQIDRFKFYKEFVDTLQQNFTVNQQYLFFGINYSKKRFYFNPAINLSGINMTTIVNLGPDPSTQINHYDTIPYQERGFLFSARTGYKFNTVHLGLLTSFSRISQLAQYQLGAEVIYFPFGNLHSYLISNIMGHWESNIAYLFFRQKMGMRFNKALWGELDIKLGQFTNANLDNGYFIYNVQDAISTITDLKFIILAGKHLELDIVLQHMLKENYMWSYPSLTDHNVEPTNYQFQQFNIIGGIKWTF